jgi:hypothetical protein
VEKFGLKAEKWIISILKSNGFSVIKSSDIEDLIFKVDFWIQHDNYWIPVQFSVDKEAIISWKGTNSLRLGIVPMWIDGNKLRRAFEDEDGIELIKEFWNRVEQIIENCSIKRFQTPNWSCA